MRCSAGLLLLTLVATACHRAPDIKANATQIVGELNKATNTKDIDQLSENLYACGPDALQPIADALNQLDYRKKPQLVAVISAMPDTRAMWLVDRQLHNHDQGARTMACAGLAIHPQAPLWDVTANLTRDEDLDHEWALYALAHSDEDQRDSWFRGFVKDKDEYSRAQAAIGYRTLPGVKSVAMVRPMLKDSSPLVCMEALLTMCALKPNDLDIGNKVDEIGKKAVISTGDDQQSFVLLLGGTRHPNAEPYLSQLMSGPDPRVRALAARQYAKLGKAANASRLVHSFTTDPDYAVRMAAGKSLAALHVNGMGQPLMRIIWSKDRDMAKIALDTLVDLARPDCAGPLMGIVQKFPNLNFRREAAIGLSNMAIGKKPIKEINDILEMSSSDDATARREAAVLLGRLQGPRFFVRLQDMMRDQDPTVRVAAMDSLKRQTHMSRIWPRPRLHPGPSWLEDIP